MISERARPLVKAALERRLSELGRLEAGAPAPAAADPEEALRRLMVVWLPRLAEKARDPRGREELASLLFSLEAAAKTDDVRFLDAWSSIHESAPRDEAFRADPRWREVLSAYGRILEAWIARLALPVSAGSA
jgi:hypothetical protein